MLLRNNCSESKKKIFRKNHKAFLTVPVKKNPRKISTQLFYNDKCFMSFLIQYDITESMIYLKI